MHCILQVHSLGKLLHVLLTQLASMCLAPTTTTTTTGTTTFSRVLLWHVFAFLAGIGGGGISANTARAANGGSRVLEPEMNMFIDLYLCIWLA